jgi:hypothetical protein
MKHVVTLVVNCKTFHTNIAAIMQHALSRCVAHLVLVHKKLIDNVVFTTITKSYPYVKPWRSLHFSTAQLCAAFRFITLVLLFRLSYLDNRLKGPVDPRSEDYAPLATYRHTLLMGENDTTIQQSRLAPPTGTGRRGRGAKRKLNIEGWLRNPTRRPKTCDSRNVNLTW